MNRENVSGLPITFWQIKSMNRVDVTAIALKVEQ